MLRSQRAMGAVNGRLFVHRPEKKADRDISIVLNELRLTTSSKMSMKTECPFGVFSFKLAGDQIQ